MSDKALTLLSIFCQGFSGYPKVAVPEFLESRATCLCTSSCFGSHGTRAPRALALEWRTECNGLSESLAWNFSGRVNFQNPQVDLMSAIATSTTFLSIPSFPAGVEARWETQNRRVWNELEHASEERELVYEISWIAELGIWRRFLRSNRKVQS